MTAPAHFRRLEAVDLALRDQSLLHLGLWRGELLRCGRRQRRGVGNANQRGSTCRRSDGEFDESAKCHEISFPVED